MKTKCTSSSRSDNILRLLLLLTYVPQQVMAQLEAYIYYKDAECVKNNMVSGTLVYAYTAARMSGRGMIKENYYGPCKYFEGGYHDFMYGTMDGSYMKTGYCINCNGVIGCTKTKYSCSDFQTLVPRKSYTSSLSTSNQTDSFSSSETEEDDVSEVLSEETEEALQKVEYEVYKAISMSSVNTEQSLVFFSILGMFCGCLSMFIMSSTIKGIKKLRRSKASIDTSHFLDHDEQEFHEQEKVDNNIEITCTKDKGMI